MNVTTINEDGSKVLVEDNGDGTGLAIVYDVIEEVVAEYPVNDLPVDVEPLVPVDVASEGIALIYQALTPLTESSPSTVTRKVLLDLRQGLEDLLNS